MDTTFIILSILILSNAVLWWNLLRLASSHNRLVKATESIIMLIVGAVGKVDTKPGNKHEE